MLNGPTETALSNWDAGVGGAPAAAARPAGQQGNIPDRDERGEIPFFPTPVWKRAFDLVAASLGLVLLSPLFALVAIVVRLGSPGPVFFRQARVGARGELFDIWKFRTLRQDVDAGRHRDMVARMARSNETLTKQDHQENLVWGGAFLRKYSLDELPQLWNVLRGEMSLIGPRPDVIDLAGYTRAQRRRFAVAPGLTGLWQVSGKNRLTFDQMIALDLEYVEKRSPGLDLKILVRTIPLVLGSNAA